MPSKLRTMGIERAGDIYKIDPRLLKECPYGNARTTYDPVKLQELADSIKEHGVQQAIVVYVEGADVFVVDGHRRRLAALLAIAQGTDIRAIPAVLQPKEERSELDILTRQLTANQSEKLPPMDEAHAFYRYVKHGWTQQQVATKLGFPASYVSNRIALLRADTPLQEQVIHHEATPTEVVEAVRLAARETIPQGEALVKARANKAVRTASAQLTPRPPAPQDSQERRLRHILGSMDKETILLILFEFIPKGDVERFIYDAALTDTRLAMAP